jgi:DNA-binding MarR family transcriptional regulator
MRGSCLDTCRSPITPQPVSEAQMISAWPPSWPPMESYGYARCAWSLSRRAPIAWVCTVNAMRTELVLRQVCQAAALVVDHPPHEILIHGKPLSVRNLVSFSFDNLTFVKGWVCRVDPIAWTPGRTRPAPRSTTARSTSDCCVSSSSAPWRTGSSPTSSRPGFDDVTIAQARVLARVGSKGTRITDLAEQARVTKQTVTFMVDQLERAGYVRRVADPIDARARLVIFADRGLAAKEVARRTEVAVQDEWTRHLGRRATTRLHQILTQLREITDPYR